MRLPKAIQEAIDQANLFDAAQTGNTETPPQDQALDDPQTQVASDLPAEPAAPVRPTPTDDVVWEHKYKTLQGMYNAEVPQLHANVRQLTQQVNELNAKLMAKPQTQQASQAQPLVTEKDTEAFGADLIDLIKRSVHQETARLQGENQELRNEITTLKSQLGNVSERQTVDARQVFFDTLDRSAPNWKSLNVDQAFMAWLQEIDDMSGKPRQMALDDAGNTLDGKRASAIFNAYNKLVAPAPPPAPNNGLQRQVVPSTKRTGPAPAASPEKPIFTQAQISTFYENARRGHLTPEQIAQGEATINAAVAEGRVR